MMLRYWLVLMAALMLAEPLRAATTLPSPTQATVPPDLPERLLKQLNRAKSRFLEDAAALILGYGSADGINAKGIETYISTHRAEIRVREMRDLLEGDLDNDGSIGGEELVILVANASASQRGRLQVAHAAADDDTNGSVTALELRLHGQARALQLFDEVDANDWRQFILFDLDQNGRVALPEVMEVVRMLEQAG